MHKSICAIYDDPRAECDCGHMERTYGEPLRNRIKELEVELEKANEKLRLLESKVRWNKRTNELMRSLNEKLS